MKKSVIINCLLVIVVLGLVGYILIDKKIINLSGNVNQKVEEPKEEIKEEQEEKSLDINDSLVEKYFNMYKYFQEECVDEELLNDETEARLHLVLNEIPSSYYENISCDELNNLTIDDTYYCSSMMVEDFTNDLEKLKFENTSIIAENIILNKYQEIFGKDSKYQKEDIKTFGGMYHYDSKNKGYAYYRINAGGSCIEPNITLESATLKDDNLKLIILKDYNEEDESLEYQDKKLTINLKYEKDTGNYIFDNITSEVQ